MKQHPFASEMKRWILLTELAMFLLFYQLCSGNKPSISSQVQQKPELYALPIERTTLVNVAPVQQKAHNPAPVQNPELAVTQPLHSN
ncbi:MAG: hypothetical protein JNJ57_08180 [Saprospiraceae bacterium]|nr:hypothetical protein [Saprospiraceae bacterium]